MAVANAKYVSETTAQKIERKKMSKKVVFPNVVYLSYLKIELKLVDHEMSYEAMEQQGSFHGKVPCYIVLDKEIIEKGGSYAVNLVLHEMSHAIEYLQKLDKSDEENRVSTYANYITEILCRSSLSNWIREESKLG